MEGTLGLPLPVPTPLSPASFPVQLPRWVCVQVPTRAGGVMAPGHSGPAQAAAEVCVAKSWVKSHSGP